MSEFRYTDADVAAILARAMQVERKLDESRLAEERYRVLLASAEELGITTGQLRRAIERYEAVSAPSFDWTETDLCNVLTTALGLREEPFLERAMEATARQAGISDEALALARDQYDREQADRLLRREFTQVARRRRLILALGAVAMLALWAAFSWTAAVVIAFSIVLIIVFWPGELWYTENEYEEWVRELAARKGSQTSQPPNE